MPATFVVGVECDVRFAERMRAFVTTVGDFTVALVPKFMMDMANRT